MELSFVVTFLAYRGAVPRREQSFDGWAEGLSSARHPLHGEVGQFWVICAPGEPSGRVQLSQEYTRCHPESLFLSIMAAPTLCAIDASRGVSTLGTKGL